MADGPASISYREAGSGAAAVFFLHGGWGYQIYPINTQAEALAPRCRVFVPDSSGYGQSSAVASLPVDFHRRAMLESSLFLDAAGIERAIWWAHSDGAVIAALAAVRCALPQARFECYPDAGHSPHSERARATPITETIVDFIASIHAS